MRSTPAKVFSVYKNKPFARFAKRARITDAELWKSAMLANEGVVDANLGGGVIKQRIARAGEGKSSGSRTILLFRKDDRAVFVFGYEKKDMANISANDLSAFREFALLYLSYSAARMKELVEAGTIFLIEKPQRDEDA